VVNVSHSGFSDRAAASVPRRTTHFEHYLKRPILQLGPLLFGAAVIATIIFAWIERDEGHLTAEKGLGYWLGISGAVIMLTLIGYPLRKRVRVLHSVGRVANWFRLHMILGILGPLCVVLHTNFKLGSMNSRLALFTMLVVVSSGIVGRYLYAKVHKGLYGKQAELRDVLSDIASLRQSLGNEVAGLAGIERELSLYVPKLDARQASLLTGFFSALTAGSRTRASRRRILSDVRQSMSAQTRPRSWSQKRAHLKDVDRQLKVYFAAVKKAEKLAFFERLFGMWHHLHFPLFVLLALTVVLHILAVHQY
jgi:hypothetical protein